ncbi:MAG: UPF0182 family protein [bacterium]|nr:UPF0182 family protein [bacterium]
MTGILTIIGLIIGIIAAVIKYNRQDEDKAWPPIKLGLTVFFIFLGIGAVIDIAANVYTDFLWFEELGYTSVWLKRLELRVALYLGGTIIAWVFFYLNAMPAWKATLRRIGDCRGYNIPDEEDWVKGTPWVKWACLAVAALFGLYALSGWDEILKFFNATPFGMTDPVHGLDLSFYIFGLPFWNWAKGFLLILVLGAAVVAGVVYAIYGLMTKDDSIGRPIFAHTSVLGAFLVWIIAWQYNLQRFNLLIDGNSNRLVGAGYTDVHVLMGNLNVMAWVAILVGAVLLVNVFIRNWKVLATAGGIWLLMATILLAIAPGITQWLKVNPSEMIQEAPYITNYINMTRAAYGLDAVESHEVAYQPGLDPEEYEANDATLSRARVMDWRPLLDANDTLQEIRVYYDFNDTDIDRYVGTEYMVGVRELSIDQLPTQAQTWSNEHLQYTHGEGFTVAEVSQVESQGLPVYTVKNIPPEGPEEFSTEYTEIYFGELTSDWIAVNTTLDEFGQPSGAGAEYERYQGTSGIRLTSLNRWAFAIHLGDLKILISKFITPDSRIIFDRAIGDRVEKIAPMLTYDGDPYAVVGSDQVYWIWDACTTAKTFPYSDPTDDDINYIRNSVKIVIGAYDGNVRFYVADPEDPVLRVWMNVFPGLFRSMDEMPEFIKLHLRYPADIFTIQAEKLALFHMTDTTSFYNREDLWMIPQEAYLDAAVTMDPRFISMRLPGEDENEFVLVVPFTPANKQNLVGWLCVRMDAPHYGEMELWLFPRDQTVIGPMQVEGLINQDPVMSGNITLWSQRGSTLLWGNLLALPVFNDGNGSVVYVKPLFILAEQGKIPALTRVILWAGDRLIVEATLQDALAVLYGGQTTETVVSPPTTTGVVATCSELANAAYTYFQQAQSCYANSDWACYGTAMQKLEETLLQASQCR